MKTTRLLISVFLAVLGLSLGWFALQQARANAPKAEITVTSRLDVINYNDHLCTLREAIIAAETDSTPGFSFGECPAGSGADTILLDSGIYTFTISGMDEDESLTGDFDITTPITITGMGIDCLSQSKNCTQINAASLDRAFEVFPHGSLALQKAIVHNGFSYNSDGGCILNNDDLWLQETIVADCTSNGFGGGLSNWGTAAIQNSIFADNHGNGGAIFNVDSLDIRYTQFLTNQSDDYGGGVYVSGGTVTIDHALFAENSANYSGGGIFIGAPTTISNSIFSGNSAEDYGGAFGQAGYAHSTFENVTMTGNTAPDGGAAGLVDNSTVTLLNVSIVANESTTGAGGIFVESSDVQLNLQNSIIAANQLENCSGPITSLGNNLEDSDLCSLTAAGDLVNTDPLLGPLQDNGGFTLTLALLEGSPAIDAGSQAVCPSVDQRDAARPQDGDFDGTEVCDIGAYEAPGIYKIYLPVSIKLFP